MREHIKTTTLCLICCQIAFGQSSIDDPNKFGWSENAGWFNWRDANGTIQGVIVTTEFLSGYVWCENAGWINFGDGTPADGQSYGNVDGTDFGVNILLDTDLDGYGWGENVGWINFGWGAELDKAGRARFDGGQFHGFAWGENIGWINLNDVSTICGNGNLDPGEECDDGNTDNSDGCSSTCTVEPDCQCTGDPSVCTCCGDGSVEGSEACDDGNNDNTDACLNTCVNARCGDKVPGPGEDCDDGVKVAVVLGGNPCLTDTIDHLNVGSSGSGFFDSRFNYSLVNRVKCSCERHDHKAGAGHGFADCLSRLSQDVRGFRLSEARASSIKTLGAKAGPR
ncbi:MAG: DUF4215 domain-containing protein [Planctomycetes bacterium]|nr:DUF4215 domain-containing protein [Planctomycetota bacterium]